MKATSVLFPFFVFLLLLFSGCEKEDDLSGTLTGEVQRIIDVWDIESIEIYEWRLQGGSGYWWCAHSAAGSEIEVRASVFVIQERFYYNAERLVSYEHYPTNQLELYFR